MITIENANEFFVHKVKELLGAEEQVQVALMNWKEMVASERLRAMLARRLDGSDLQRDRLHQQLERLGHAKQAADNATIFGITQDGARITGTLARGPLRDLAIMASASALGHFQVATYQFLHRMSEWHGLTDYREYLEATLQEVQEATSQLDQLAFDGIPIPVNPGSDETPEASGETSPETDPSGSPKETKLMRTSERERDQYGRFVSDDDRSDRSNRDRGRDDDNDRGRNSGSNRGGRSYEDDDRDRGRGRGNDDGRGWYGDREGHSEAARGGWDSRDDDRDNRGRNNDRDRDEYGRFTSDDNRGSNRGGGRDDSGRDRDEYGRFTSGSSRGGRDDDDRGRDYDRDRGYSGRSSGNSRSGRDYDDRNDGRGWYGDSEGHSEAARKGWDNRDDDRRSSNRGGRDDDDRGRDEYGRFTSGNNRGSSRDDDRGRNNDRDRDEYGRFTSGSSRGGRDDDDDRGRGRRNDDGPGWHGDSRGHAEAARKGWENRNR